MLTTQMRIGLWKALFAWRPRRDSNPRHLVPKTSRWVRTHLHGAHPPPRTDPLRAPSAPACTMLHHHRCLVRCPRRRLILKKLSSLSVRRLRSTPHGGRSCAAMPCHPCSAGRPAFRGQDGQAFHPPTNILYLRPRNLLAPLGAAEDVLRGEQQHVSLLAMRRDSRVAVWAVHLTSTDSHAGDGTTERACLILQR